jgi:integrase
MNANLKIIGEKIGLEESTIKTRNQGSKVITETYQKFQQLTTHTCRRSFCTNAFLSGIHPKILMKISGHKTERSFMRYIKVSNVDNALMIADHELFHKR